MRNGGFSNLIVAYSAFLSVNCDCVRWPRTAIKNFQHSFDFFTHNFFTSLDDFEKISSEKFITKKASKRNKRKDSREK